MSIESVLAGLPAREPAEKLKPVVDPAAWTGADLERDQRWKIDLTDAEIRELDAAVATVRDRGLDIKDITADDFPLPRLDDRLAEVKAQLMDGLGMSVIRGVPVERYGIVGAAAAFWGFGLRLGVPVSQNHKGHLLGHVADLVGPSRAASFVRGYHTSAELNYHTDSCDVVGLICLQTAKSGGLSSVASMVAVYNEILRRRPDLAAELVKSWPRDRRDEIPPGKKPWFDLPIFNFDKGYFTASWHNFYIRSSQRFEELPRYTETQLEALDMIDIVANELRSDLAFRPGDVQFLHNHVVTHARTAYEDWPERERRRHLLRLWLATPDGRPLPDQMLDRYVGLKPGQRPSGIVVEGTTLCTPLEPE
jgi:hypothetical protein